MTILPDAIRSSSPTFDYIPPVKRGEQIAELTVRTVTRPDCHVAELLARLDLDLPRRNLILGETVKSAPGKM
jgi:hypothetical protein